MKLWATAPSRMCSLQLFFCTFAGERTPGASCERRTHG